MIRHTITVFVFFWLLGTGCGPVAAGGWLSENLETIDAKVSHYYDEDARVESQADRKRVRRRAINPVDRRSLLAAPEIRRRSRAPSIAISVGLNGKLLVAKGYGQARPGVKADARTLYHIGSLTKQFTAAALLDLVDKRATSRANGRRVELDTPLHHLFFGVEHWSKDGEPPVTIRRLLTMTSNLPNYTRRLPGDLDPWGAIKAPRLLAAIRRMRPHGWANSFEYSNTSYFLLAQIIESLGVAGETELYSYRDRLRLRIFEPARMNATQFVGDDIGKSVLALPNDTRRPAFTKRDWLKGSADVVSNVTDMFAWNTALMNGRIARAPMRDLMFSEAARVAPLEWYGMGWFVKPGKNRDVYFHSGTVPGYTSFNVIVREHENNRWAAVTILTNRGQVKDLDRLALELVDLAFKRPVE